MSSGEIRSTRGHVDLDWLKQNVDPAKAKVDGKVIHCALDGSALSKTDRKAAFMELVCETYNIPMPPPGPARDKFIAAFLGANPKLAAEEKRFEGASGVGAKSIDLPITDPTLTPDMLPAPPKNDAGNGGALVIPEARVVGRVDEHLRAADEIIGKANTIIDAAGKQPALKDSPILAQAKASLADAKALLDDLASKKADAETPEAEAKIQAQMDQIEAQVKGLRDAFFSLDPTTIQTAATKFGETVAQWKQAGVGDGPAKADQAAPADTVAETKSAWQVAGLKTAINKLKEPIRSDVLSLFDNKEFKQLLLNDPKILSKAMSGDVAAMKQLSAAMPAGELKKQLDMGIGALGALGGVVSPAAAINVLGPLANSVGLGNLVPGGELLQTLGDLQAALPQIEAALADPTIRGLLGSDLPVGSVLRGIADDKIPADLLGKVLGGTASLNETASLMQSIAASCPGGVLELKMNDPVVKALAQKMSLPLDPSQLDSVQIGPGSKMTINSKDGAAISGKALGIDADVSIPSPLSIDLSKVDPNGTEMEAKLGYGDTLQAAFEMELHPTGNADFDAFLTVLVKILMAIPMLFIAMGGSTAKIQQTKDGTKMSVEMAGMTLAETEKKKKSAAETAAANQREPMTMDQATDLYGQTLGSVPPSVVKKNNLEKLWGAAKAGDQKSIDALVAGCEAAQKDAAAASGPLEGTSSRLLASAPKGSGQVGSNDGFQLKTTPIADPDEAETQFAKMICDTYDIPANQYADYVAKNPRLKAAADAFVNSGGKEVKLDLPKTLERIAAPIDTANAEGAPNAAPSNVQLPTHDQALSILGFSGPDAMEQFFQKYPAARDMSPADQEKALTVTALTAQGNQAEAKGDYDAALAFSQKAEEVMPGSAVAKAHTALCLENLQRNDEAKAKYQEVITAAGDNPRYAAVKQDAEEGLARLSGNGDAPPQRPTKEQALAAMGLEGPDAWQKYIDANPVVKNMSPADQEAFLISSRMVIDSADALDTDPQRALAIAQDSQKVYGGPYPLIAEARALDKLGDHEAAVAKYQQAAAKCGDDPALADAKQIANEGAAAPAATQLPALPFELSSSEQLRKLSDRQRAELAEPLLQALGVDVKAGDIPADRAYIYGIQKLCGVKTPDGVWGPETHQAVADYLAKGGDPTAFKGAAKKGYDDAKAQWQQSESKINAAIDALVDKAVKDQSRSWDTSGGKTRDQMKNEYRQALRAKVSAELHAGKTVDQAIGEMNGESGKIYEGKTNYSANSKQIDAEVARLIEAADKDNTRGWLKTGGRDAYVKALKERAEKLKNEGGKAGELSDFGTGGSSYKTMTYPKIIAVGAKVSGTVSAGGPTNPNASNKPKREFGPKW